MKDIVSFKYQDLTICYSYADEMMMFCNKSGDSICYDTDIIDFTTLAETYDDITECLNLKEKLKKLTYQNNTSNGAFQKQVDQLQAQIARKVYDLESYLYM